MVFVINTSLDMGPGKTAAQVGHAALGVQRVLTIKSNKPCQIDQHKYKVSTTDLGLWQDFGYNLNLNLKNIQPIEFETKTAEVVKRQDPPPLSILTLEPILGQESCSPKRWHQYQFI